MSDEPKWDREVADDGKPKPPLKAGRSEGDNLWGQSILRKTPPLDGLHARILAMIAEWQKGCSNTLAHPGVMHSQPESCPECTRALIDAIHSAASNEVPRGV